MAEYLGFDVREGEPIENIRSRVEKVYTRGSHGAFHAARDDSRSRKVRQKLERKKRKKTRRIK